MAKIVSYSGKLPKRILDNYVIYKLGQDLIIREKSGFTREALLSAAKYANCRNNSSEFGRVSRTCEGIRVALAGILPKKNNLDVVNSLTKFMRSLLTSDLVNSRGNRMLQTALEHEDGHQRLIGYDFNPASTFSLATTFSEKQLTVHASETLLKAVWVGFRVHVLAFDWEGMAGELHSGGWHFEQGVQKATTYTFPEPAAYNRSLFYLLEVQNFDEKEGAFLPLEGKSLQIVGYEAAFRPKENDEIMSLSSN
jgi:hypothetical protein